MQLSQTQSNVLVGHDNFLFLCGGDHNPLAYCQGEKKVAPSSISTFWDNLQKRKQFVECRGALFGHIIAPCKHSVCSEVFPVEIETLLGELYLSSAPSGDLLSSVLYPVDTLSARFRDCCYRVDTHYRPLGTALLVSSVLKRLNLGNDLGILWQHISSGIDSVPDWPGDLGSKFDPPRMEKRLLVQLPKSVVRYSSILEGGNNGIFDLYLNRSTDPLPLGRVMLFGDSYGRDMCALLASISREVLFLRTPFCHFDLVDAALPDLVITENAERYLSSVAPDDDRPLFFLFPFFRELNYRIPVDSAKALSAFFSAGRSKGSAFTSSPMLHTPPRGSKCQMDNAMEIKGQYITPLAYDIEDGLYGSVYDKNLALIPESLRDCTRTGKRHRDPYYLHPAEAKEAIELKGKIIYLGHHFNHYGHFILETLPMLSFLLSDQSSIGVMLGFSGKTDRSVLDSFLEILDIEVDRVIVHDKRALYSGDISVYPRPIAINCELRNRQPYLDILAKIHSSVKRGETPLAKHLFLERDSSRVDEPLYRGVASYLHSIGFAAVDPESISIEAQMALYRNAAIIVGFSGSQMHNCMFMLPSARVIILGDQRHPRHGSLNQQICSDISSVRSGFIPYGPDMLDHLKSTLG